MAQREGGANNFPLLFFRPIRPRGFYSSLFFAVNSH
jgi:hypothetical protein